MLDQPDEIARKIRKAKTDPDALPDTVEALERGPKRQIYWVFMQLWLTGRWRRLLTNLLVRNFKTQRRAGRTGDCHNRADRCRDATPDGRSGRGRCSAGRWRAARATLQAR